MFTFYKSVCNLIAPTPNPVSIKAFPSINVFDNDYIVSKNEANETIILEIPKQPKLYYTWKNNKK
jgi:hypothetical protein